MKRWLTFLLFVAILTAPLRAQEEKLVIGSKAFAESWILGEAMVKLARGSGAQVEFKRGLGATQIIYEALRQGDVDVYPEYIGTIKQVFLKDQKNASDADVLSYLARNGIGVSYSLGFPNGFALAVSENQKGLETLSDLAQHPELKVAVNNEFAGRKDGWIGLVQAYGFKPTSFTEMDHNLLYGAIEAGKVDVINVYTTDAQLKRLKLRTLRDDKKFFPSYDCVMLYRADLPSRCPKAWAAMQELVGRVTVADMIAANARQVEDKIDAKDVASEMLDNVLPKTSSPGSNPTPVAKQRHWDWEKVGKNIGDHLWLVAISLSVAMIIGIPLGVLASRSRSLATSILSLIALLQTIPSLALLAFLVPIFGAKPIVALIALFIYSLLPIVRNTYTGLTNIPGNLSEAAEAIGLSPGAQLWQVRLPMASPSILAGIKTSAVINVGTATLAALVGAGGLGTSILQGIALLDNDLIFQGAIPAAALAILVQFAFDALERVVVPLGLRL